MKEVKWRDNIQQVFLSPFFALSAPFRVWWNLWTPSHKNVFKWSQYR